VPQYESGFGWQQIMEWAALPTGTLVDFGDPTNCTFLAGPPHKATRRCAIEERISLITQRASSCRAGRC
jgi:hypothetical protein